MACELNPEQQACIQQIVDALWQSRSWLPEEAEDTEKIVDAAISAATRQFSVRPKRG